LRGRWCRNLLALDHGPLTADDDLLPSAVCRLRSSSKQWLVLACRGAERLLPLCAHRLELGTRFQDEWQNSDVAHGA